MSARSLTVSFLSLSCIGVFLYYSLNPAGPHLFQWIQQASNATGSDSNDRVKGSETDFAAAEKFDPQVLLSAPRRGNAIPNEGGTQAVYTVSTYSFKSHIKTKEIRVLDLRTGQSHLVTNADNAGSPNWLDDGQLLWLEASANTTAFIVGNADAASSKHTIAELPASFSDVKVKRLGAGKYAIAAVALAEPDGRLHNPGAAKTPYTSAKIYDHIFVRHWDEYVVPQKNAIWHGIIAKTETGARVADKGYSMTDLTNVLQGTKLESPIPNFGGLDNFDLGKNGIALVAKDPSLNSALNTKSSFYYVSIDEHETGLKYGLPVKSEVQDIEGASTSPCLSPDGQSAVFLQMKENGYESDQNHLILVNFSSSESPIEVIITNDGHSLWDQSPGSVSFGADTRTILFTAQAKGKTILYMLRLPEENKASVVQPIAITHTAHVAGFHTISGNPPKLLVSSSSFIDNSFYSTVDLSVDEPQLKSISSSSRNGSFFGLSREQLSEIWFDGDGDRVHAWVIKPSTFDAQQTYPLAYIIHGGPQGSWEDSWSTRWNPAVFAEQGYIVVLPDPTGSTGYGQGFTDAIKDQWGGRPYKDLVNGFEYIKSNLPYVDTGRSVALGASYGGYMMAWMQGHELAKRFKALVCHDGILNLPAQLGSEEQYFPNHDLGGPPTSDPHAWDEWSPQAHISNWTTPMLVIHNALDYRLPISEGLAMFNVLQERKVSSRFLTFPDENHWVLKEENSLVWHTVVLNWINSYVGLPQYKDERDLGLVVQN